MPRAVFFFVQKLKRACASTSIQRNCFLYGTLGNRVAGKMKGVPHQLHRKGIFRAHVHVPNFSPAAQVYPHPGTSKERRLPLKQSRFSILRKEAFCTTPRPHPILHVGVDTVCNLADISGPAQGANGSKAMLCRSAPAAAWCFGPDALNSARIRLRVK